MRKLTAGQKQILDDWFKVFGHTCGIFFTLETNEFFTEELLAKLEKINDYETLHWDINRYISDKAAEAAGE